MGRFEGGSVTAKVRAFLAGRVQDRQELPLLPRGGAECTCRKKAPMAVSHFEQFLDQPTIPESGTDCALACDDTRLRMTGPAVGGYILAGCPSTA